MVRLLKELHELVQNSELSPLRTEQCCDMWWMLSSSSPLSRRRCCRWSSSALPKPRLRSSPRQPPACTSVGARFPFLFACGLLADFIHFFFLFFSFLVLCVSPLRAHLTERDILHCIRTTQQVACAREDAADGGALFEHPCCAQRCHVSAPLSPVRTKLANPEPQRGWRCALPNMKSFRMYMWNE